MDPIGEIPPQEWMTRPETGAVMAALSVMGADVRFVGGCVRDAVRGRPNKDIDIATPDTPDRVLELLADAGIRAIPTGIDHGTVTAVIGLHHFEITTLRIDVETDGRRARVAFTDDWLADAHRRDFTINTLSCGLDGKIHDPLNGLDALAYGEVKFVGRAVERIEEDVLRILRFFRFFGIFGVPPADPDALAACRTMAPRLPELSGERVCGELLGILLSPEPADVFLLMQGERVLDYILPEATNIGRLRAVGWLESHGLKMDTVAPDAIRRLASVLETDRSGVEEISARLRFSSREKQRLLAMVCPGFVIGSTIDEKSLRRAIHRAGTDTVRDLVLLAWGGERAVGDSQSSKNTSRWIALLGEIDKWQPLTFPIKGRDAIDLGISPGPRVGEVLNFVEDWWEDGDYRASRAECLDKLSDAVKDLL